MATVQPYQVDGQGRARVHHAEPARRAAPGTQHCQPAVHPHAQGLGVAVDQTAGGGLTACKPRQHLPALPQQCRQFALGLFAGHAGNPDFVQLFTTGQQLIPGQCVLAPIDPTGPDLTVLEQTPLGAAVADIQLQAGAPAHGAALSEISPP